MRKRIGPIAATLVGLIGLPLLVFTQRMAIYDWARLYNYSPATEIIGLADRTTMSASSRRLFYVYHPVIQQKADFNISCREDEHTIVLGCYVSGKGIYLLDITDPRLEGIEEVTAAHEMLHAAYERLSGPEKRRVNGLLNDALRQIKNDRILETVDLYRKQDASSVDNELHSILGTEVRELPEALEQHYARYFSDRAKVVGFSEQYERAFTERRDKIAAYDAELASLKAQIDETQANLEKMLENLTSQRAALEAYRSSGNIDAYNAGVPAFNRQVSRYNALIDEMARLVSSYNDIVSKRNALASEEQDLVKAIDSRETVPEKQ